MSLSTATVVSPISRTKEGFFWRRRTRLPGTIPRELSLSSRFLDFGVMNTIRTSSPRTASDKRVTSGLFLVRVLAHAFPPGVGEPALIPRRPHKPRGGEFFDEPLRLVLFRPPEELGPGRPPFLAEGPHELEDFVLSVIGHRRDPFANRDRTKFTTFDSGTGNE